MGEKDEGDEKIVILYLIWYWRSESINDSPIPFLPLHSDTLNRGPSKSWFHEKRIELLRLLMVL